MESKLQELTKKIYKEGVLKGEEEAKNILDSAKNEAENIINKAKKDAENIIIKAKSESEQLKSKILSELKMSSGQAISLLKQNITDLLVNNTLSDDVKKISSDVDFIKEIISQIISKWSPDNKNIDLELILPDKMKNELVSYFKNKAKDVLNKGIELKFDSRMENGFKIGPKDKSFILSFTEKDFDQFLKSFLKEKSREILF
ncbi:MAG: V-type ATP synthase subunit E [Spirochaetes bacterium]|nr:V-type ATP synthase subunit E [Spirochaetota bacterium]